MRAAFHTLGCRVNQYETEAIREKFRKAGWEIVGEDEKADAYIINTCTVTNLADRKSRQFIRRVHAESPDAVIAVTGCYAQTSPEEVAAIEGVSLVVGTDEKANILDMVEAKVSGRAGAAVVQIKPYDDLDKYEELGIITSMDDRCRAFIKIEEGCNRFCSYCIIPYARGKVRSRAPEEIIEEASRLIGNGFEEITLTGINTALYGTDIGMGGIAPLLEELDRLPGDFRIRLSSLEPTVIDADYVKKLFGVEKLCHHLHLSAQSGSDSVLAAMNRRYDRSEYLDIVKTLRDFDPLYGISTDMIAGFPGETDKDAEDSARLLEEMMCCRSHIFKYSMRKGTKAAAMECQVSGEKKRERSEMLIEAGKKAAAEFFSACSGAERRVLFEKTEDVNGSEMASGYTDNFVRTYVPASQFDAGDAAKLRDGKGVFKDVKLGQAFADGMDGVIA
ncbi:MAG: tRNA (N(6)-L-threonylcarbamoyladenosine(37)-C(2))-methylthiotransferase MtaB [Anaerovoracaceae bacterium]